MNAGRQDPGYVDRRTDTTAHGGLLSTSPAFMRLSTRLTRRAARPRARGAAVDVRGNVTSVSYE